MLRTLFVLILVVFGAYYALQGPFYALLFYMGNAYFRPDFWAWGDLVKQLHLSLVSGAFVLFSTIVTKQKLVMNGRIGLVLFFFYYTFLSTLFSSNFDTSLVHWVEFCKVMLISYLTIVLVTNLSRFRLLLLVITLAIGIEGAKQGWVYLVTMPEWGANPNKLPFLGDNNDVAVGMFMMVPIALLLAKTSQYRWAQYGYWILTVGLIARALTTYSRGAFLTGLALAGVYWLRSQHKLRAVLGALIMLMLLLPALPQEYWDRMGTISSYQEQDLRSPLGRLHFWSVAVDMANTNPVFGVGFMGYMDAYNNYDTSKGEYGHDRATHSAYFQVLAELGYIGVILYLLVFVNAFHGCYLVRQRAKHNPALATHGQYAFALENSLCALLVGSLFLSFAYKEIVWHFIALTIIVEQLAFQAETVSETSSSADSDTAQYAEDAEDAEETDNSATQPEPVYLGSRLFAE